MRTGTYARIVARLNAVIKETTDDRFRRAIAARDGIGKGNLSAALEEAIEMWLKENEERPRKAHGGGRT